MYALPNSMPRGFFPLSSDFSPELKRELLDDFYTECDELLTGIRGNLGDLENDNARAPSPAVVEALFRNVHSLKGISAIVGLRPAEQLAHAMEELLRAMTKGVVVFPEGRMDVLSNSAQRLEQIVVAHRLGKKSPDIDDVLAMLEGMAPAGTKQPWSKMAPTGVADGTQLSGEGAAFSASPTRQVPPDVPRYLISFTPSAALNERGININAVRERLGRIGEIQRATPSVRGQGSIVFEFVVAVRDLPADLSTWEQDGMLFQPFGVTPVPSPEATGGTSSPLEQAEALSIAPSHIVRVDLTRLDELMRITGEMVILRSRLEERLGIDDGNDRAGLKEINLALGRSLREMRTAISKVRTVPIAEIFSRMPFVIRDLSRGSEKKVRVALEGHNTEVDKYIVERLKEPLLHLVRNAFAHGIETPEQRLAAGKPAEATIVLSARTSGQSVVIQVRDDGGGIDIAAVAARASALGIPVPQPLDLPGVLKILGTSGFSTRQEADLASGRGVGMAVVAATVRELGGTLAMQTTLGAGTEFTVKLPVTLAIMEAIIVTVGAENCAVPQSAVEEIIQISAQEIRTIKRTEVIPYREGLLPFLRLRKLFKLPSETPETVTMLVVQGERGSTGVLVDRVRSQREIVVRPLSDPLLRVPGISGATELGDGRPILIFDPIAIADGVVRPPTDFSAVNPDLSQPRAS